MLQVEGRDRWLAFYIPMIFELTEQLIGHLQAEVRRAHLAAGKPIMAHDSALAQGRPADFGDNAAG